MKPNRPKRGDKGKFDTPRGRKRRDRDDDAAPHHPAYEPLDMKALARDLDGDARPPRKDRHANTEDGERKPRGSKAAKSPSPKKKAAKKNKPSRAARKAAKSKS